MDHLTGIKARPGESDEFVASNLRARQQMRVMEPGATQASRDPQDRPVTSAVCKRCPARTECLLFKLRERHGWAALRPLRRTFRVREVVFKEGEPTTRIMVLARGRLLIRRRDAAGDLLFVERLSPGRLIDYRALLAGVCHLATARPLGSVEVCSAPREAVASLVALSSSMALDLLQEAERELHHVEQAIRLRAARPMLARIGLALQMFAETEGQQGADGAWHFELPVHRRDLAALVGARPETVSRIIHSMEEQGLAHFRGRHVEIPRLELLVQG